MFVISILWARDLLNRGMGTIVRSISAPPVVGDRGGPQKM